MTSTLLTGIRAEIARLESLRRREGVVSAARVLDSLPPHVRSVCTVADCSRIADAINAALADADPVTAPTIDHQSRASNDA